MSKNMNKVLDITILKMSKCNWCYRASPSGLRADGNALTDFYRRWEPGNGQQGFLFYNPKIILYVQAFDPENGYKQIKGARHVIPINMVYRLRNCVRALYGRINDKDSKLYYEKEGQYRCDQKIADEKKVGLILPHGSVTFTPSLVSVKNKGCTKGAVITSVSEYSQTLPVELTMKELSDLYEFLDRFDPTMYALQSVVMDRLEGMQQQLDGIDYKTDKILSILDKNASPQKFTPTEGFDVDELYSEGNPWD